MLRIPLGGYLVLRDDLYHGGFCGPAGNVRIQITLIPHEDINDIRYLNHVGSKISAEKGFYDPKPVDYNKSAHILNEDIKQKLMAQKTKLADSYSDIETLYGFE